MNTNASRYVAACPSCAVNGYKPRPTTTRAYRSTFELFDAPQDVGDPYVCAWCDTPMRCPEPKCGAPLEWCARGSERYRWRCPFGCEPGDDSDEATDLLKPGVVETIAGPLGVASIVLVLNRAARDGNPWGRWTLHVRVRGRGRRDRAHLRQKRWRRVVPQGFALFIFGEHFARMLEVRRNVARGCVGAERVAP